jgi:hypothetical protein
MRAHSSLFTVRVFRKHTVARNTHGERWDDLLEVARRASTLANVNLEFIVMPRALPDLIR